MVGRAVCILFSSSPLASVLAAISNSRCARLAFTFPAAPVRVQADFRGHIAPPRLKDLGVIGIVHVLSLRLCTSGPPHERMSDLVPTWIARGLRDLRRTLRNDEEFFFPSLAAPKSAANCTQNNSANYILCVSCW